MSAGDGVLTLTVRRQSVRGTNGKTYAFTGGMISSYSSCRLAYGFMEVRLRSDTGKGLWPAF